MIRISNWLLASTGLVLLVAAIVLSHGTMSIAPKPLQPAPAGRTTLRYEPGSGQMSAIKVQEVQVFPVPLAEPLNGKVTFNENVTARVMSPIPGRVVALTAQVGDAVKAGDTLAVLDSPDLAAAVADLRKAGADEARKKPALDRARSLFEAGVFARKDLEAAEADERQAQAEVARAAMRLRNLAPEGGEDGKYAVRAPISGVVADRQLNPGMEVRPDLPGPLFIITNPARLWVVIDLPERDLSKVAPGQPVAVQVDAWQDDRFPARIEKVGEVVDPATRRVQVRCSVANPDRKLKPEMYARVTLLADENRTAVRLPNTALVTEGLYSYVFVEQSPGVFERRRVSLAVQDRDYSYVASGLQPAERVVVAGSVLLNSELGAAAQQ
jgi:cobalt-zinc-cadmium efflux system membrane fusion protein